MTVANALTMTRFLLSVIMVFLDPRSAAFAVMYAFAGLSDVMDGIAARMTGETELGARLDSLADLSFAVMAAFKILPILGLPLFVYIWAGVILLVKLVSIAAGLMRTGKLQMPHTVLNKICGVLVFLLPAVAALTDAAWMGAAVCAACTAAAVHELTLVLKMDRDGQE